jgi:SAM-dependent methyltransferase
MASFDSVVDEYDEGRPGYPAALLEALGPLRGARVLEGGAGTGIATRMLLDRGADVTPFDVGPAVLARAVRRSPGLAPVVADGAVLPFRDGCADLICFAQSWHWLAPRSRCEESRRVLRPSGRWAAWWSHARADGEPWFDTYWSTIEGVCLGTNRSQRDIDWGRDVRDSGLYGEVQLVTVPWTRRTSIDLWLTDQASHSYVAALEDPARAQLLRALARVLWDRFPDGTVEVPYETWLWIAEAL